MAKNQLNIPSAETPSSTRRQSTCQYEHTLGPDIERIDSHRTNTTIFQSLYRKYKPVHFYQRTVVYDTVQRQEVDVSSSSTNGLAFQIAEQR